MDWTEREELCKCQHELCQDLQIIEVLNILEQHDVVTYVERQQIKEEQTDYERNEKLLDVLRTKGPNSFSVFKTALIETKQEHLIEYLTKATDELMNDAQSSSEGIVNVSTASELVVRQSKALPRDPFKETVNALKSSYIKKFKKTNPLSLPFEFDIEKMWMPLTFASNKSYKSRKRYDDYRDLIKDSFEKANLLFIKGRPACGKSTLMKRIAYDWAKGEEKLANYDLVLLAEFRHLHGKHFNLVLEMVREGLGSFIEDENVYEEIKTIVDDITRLERKTKEVLVLLDGLDEAFPKTQCQELENIFDYKKDEKQLLFSLILTTRPGERIPQSSDQNRTVCEITGFESEKLQHKYICAHFKGDEDNQKAVIGKLEKYSNLTKLAQTPFHLTCICLVHEWLEKGTVVELYENICWYLLDRYQLAYERESIPQLFLFQDHSKENLEERKIIRHSFRKFPLLHKIAKLALNTLTEHSERLLTFSGKILNDRGFTEKEILTVASVGFLCKETKRNEGKFKESFSFFHSSVQEYLAAMYFCYWATDEERKPENVRSRSFMIERNYFKEIMFKELKNHVVKDIEESEIEVFIWRIAIQDSSVVGGIEKLFHHYRVIYLPLSKLQCGKTDISGLKKCLQKCINLEHLTIDSKDVNDVIVNIPYIEALKTLVFSHFTLDWKENGGFILSKSCESQHSKEDVIDLIVIKNSKFGSLDCFVEIIANEERVNFKTLLLEEVDIELSEYNTKYEIKLTCEIFTQTLKKDFVQSAMTSSNCFRKLRYLLQHTKNIPLIEFKAPFENPIPNPKRSFLSFFNVLLGVNVEKVYFYNGIFSRQPTLSDMGENDHLNAKELRFRKNMFDFQSWSLVLSFLSTRAQYLSSLIIDNVEFKFDDSFSMARYYSELVTLENVETLYISVEYTDNMKDVDWSEILEKLARDMKCLRQLDFICQEYRGDVLRVNQIRVQDAGKQRWKKFKFIQGILDPLSALQFI